MPNIMASLYNQFFLQQMSTNEDNNKKEEMRMLTRRELEDILGHKISDEAWEENLKIFAQVEQDMWEEDHPLDD